MHSTSGQGLAGRAATFRRADLITSVAPERVLGHETVTASVARPEIADEIIVQIGGGFGRHHGVRANRTSRQIAPARIGMRRGGRQNFSFC